MLPYLRPNRKAVAAAILGDNDTAFFWESRFLSRWFPLLLGLGLGILLATLIANEAWYLSVALVLAVPAIVLINRYPFAAVMIWMLLFPQFAITPTVAERTVYWILHRSLIPTALGVAIVSNWLGVRKGRPIHLGRAELAMLAFLGWTLAGIVIWNESPAQAAIRLYDRLFVPFCAYWLIRLAAPNEKDFKRFLLVAFVTLVAQCMIGLLGWFAPQVLPSQWVTLEQQRTAGSLRTEAVYTSTLLFLALLLFQYAVNCGSRCIRYPILGVFGVAIFAVFFSFSRGSWLGCLAVLTGVLVLYPRTMIRLLIILSILAYTLGSTVLADEVAWANQRAAAQRPVESRIIAGNALMGMIRAKPFYGWGYNNYRPYRVQFVTRVGNIPATVGYETQSHNTYLTILAELGMIGFFLYMFPAGWWLILSVKVRRRLPQEGFWSWRLVAMLWLLILHMFIVSNFMDMIGTASPFGVTLWWTALGMIASIVHSHLTPGDIGHPDWAC